MNTPTLRIATARSRQPLFADIILDTADVPFAGRILALYFFFLGLTITLGNALSFSGLFNSVASGWNCDRR
jgi:hypothetical protein